MKITERIFSVETGETIDVERDETAQEQAKRKAFESEMAQQKAEAEAKNAARQAILERLGLTSDELKTILG